MRGFNWFCGFGRLWIGCGLFYVYQVHIAYGSGCPRTEAEWIAEALIGSMLMVGTTLYAVGRYLGERK